MPIDDSRTRGWNVTENTSADVEAGLRFHRPSHMTVGRVVTG